MFVIAAATVGGIFAARAGQGPSKAGPSALSKPPAPSRLVSVLGQTERFTGRLRMSACKSVGLTNVQCYRPDPAIAAVTFATYKSLAALYTKYREIVGNLTRGAPLAAVENKGRSGTAPEPTDESTWNHSNVYSAKYTINQMASGNVPADVAMGRVFCGQTPNGSAVFVWTQDSGDLLGYATGSDASHEEVWQWFDEIHHQVIFPGQPAMTARATSSWP